LVEYFEQKLTDNQSDDFLKMPSKNDLPFTEKILGSRTSLTYKKTYENLTTNLGKILQKSYEVSKIGPQV